MGCKVRGQVQEARKPKGGPKNAARRVPIPPELVTLLRKHIDQHGTASDGRLFRTYRDGIYLPSTLWQVLRKARPAASTPAQVNSPLASRPYDFRHAGVSWRLNAGAPAPRWPSGPAQRRDALPDLRPLHRRRRRAMAPTDGRLPWLAESPGHGSGASPFLRPDVARCRLSHSAYIPRTLTSSGFRRHTAAQSFNPGIREFAQIRRRFAWPERAPPVGFEPTHTAPEAKLLFRDANTTKARSQLINHLPGCYKAVCLAARKPCA